MSFRRRHIKFPEWAIVVITIVAIIAIAIGIISISIISVINPAQTSKVFNSPSSPYIARIRVIGEISDASNRFASSETSYHHRWTIQTIDALIGDPENKGICLWLNTPGGTVYESDELYLKLMEYKEKTGRPIYAYMQKIAASGGYYVASAADEVFANRNTWTGSIGVTMGTLFDFSGFLDEHGIKTETIVSGRNKAMGSNYEPLTEEQREIYQSLVDEAYERFVAIVAESRGMTDKEAKALADGRIFTAEQALKAGLIDGIKGEIEAEEEIKAKFDGEAIIFDCYYRADTNYLSFLSAIIKSEKGDVAAVLDLTREQEAVYEPPIKYLYTG